MDEAARKRVTKIRSQLIMQRPFFGFLALNLEPREGKGVHNMGTDGVHLNYDPNYVANATDDELKYRIAQQVLHCGFGDLWRRQGRDLGMWGRASDIVRCLQLTQDRFVIPIEELSAALSICNLLLGEKIPSVEAVYDILQSNSKDKRKGEISDDHSKWDKPPESSKKSDGKGNDANMAQAWKERMARSRQLARAQGKDASCIAECIDEELNELLEPKLDWKELLRNFIISSRRSDYRIIPPKRRNAWQELYLPYVFDERVELAFVVDTSGSMPAESVVEGLSELLSICSQFTSCVIHFYEADDNIQLYEVLDRGCDPEKVKVIRGRGAQTSGTLSRTSRNAVWI